MANASATRSIKLKFTRDEECLLNARIELERAKHDPSRIDELRQLELHVTNFESAVAKQAAKSGKKRQAT